MSKGNKPTDKTPPEEHRDYAHPVGCTAAFILNPNANKAQLKEQAQINLMTIRSQLELLPDEALFKLETTALIYYFCIIERLANELQALLIEAQ